MKKPNLAIPEPPTPRPHGRRRWVAAAFALVAFLILVACGAAMFYLARTPAYTLPNVAIIDPIYGAELTSGRTVPVLSVARSSDRIVKQELWVDGLLVYVAGPSDPQGQKDFSATLLWVPKAGTHSLIARATDGRGSVGTSDVLRVAVIDAGTNDLQQNAIHIAEKGDSLSSIGEENNITPERMREENPDLPEQVAPGAWVFVPPGDNRNQGDDDQPGGAVQDPGAEQFPDDLLVGPADPNRDLLEFGAPLLFWDTIPSLRDPRLRAPNAPKLKADPGPNCSARLTWWDTSDNEKGFYLYRLVPSAARFEKIEPFFRANNSHAALSYTDRGIPGHAQYYVVAFNGAGEAASRTVSVDVPAASCLRDVSGQMLEVEVESLTAPGYEEMYCYAALKGHRPFERVPFEEWKYLKWMSSPQVPHRPEFNGRWNLQEYYGGPNKRVVAAPPAGQSFQVEVECWGAAESEEGGESFSLGGFIQSHPPEEWDGRALTGRGSSFTVVYHIRPWTGPAGDSDATLDPDIPAPYNLRPARDFNDCVAHTPGDGGSLFGCALANYSDHPPLIWEWDGAPEQIDGYRIYFNRVPVGGTFVPIDDMPKDLRIWVGPSEVPCGETWRYAIAAFDLNVESQMSEFRAMGGEECDNLAVVEVEFVNVTTENLDDGLACTENWFGCPDTTMDTYGEIFFDTMRASRRNPSDLVYIDSQRLRVSDDIMPVEIKSNRSYLWKDLPLCREGGGGRCWAPDQNKMVFLMREGDALSGGVRLEDADDWPNGDDHWCYIDFWFEGRSLDEWARLDQMVNEADPNPYYGKCSVGLRVRGLGRGGSSHLLAPGGGGPANTAKKADLTITGIERNRAGNARLTIHNTGPDTLVADTATLDFQVARVPSGRGGSPGTIWQHQERANLTLPAFGQTTVDTGQVLLEGFENRVRIVILPVNFTDPSEWNNAQCKRIDLPDATHQSIRECNRDQ